jgi:anti-sigma factor RsiW
MEWLVMQVHDGQLPARHRASVAAHLVDCAECRAYLGATRSISAWLRSGERAPEFSAVWQGVARRLPAPTGPLPWWGAWRWLKLGDWSFRPGWLAAVGLTVALLLLLVNPYGRLPLPQSHEASVAFVEASDYPVIVMMPAQPNEMTVIWLFEQNVPPVPPT